MKINKLIFKSEALSYLENPELEIEKISTNIFNIDNSTLYIAERSMRYDIQKLTSILKNRAVRAVVCDVELSLPLDEKYVIRVENLREKSALIHARFHNINFENMKFIGFTGTNGKSTSTLILESILLKSGKSVGLIGTGQIRINGKKISDNFYSMTTPDVALLYKSIKEMEKNGCEYVVMEVSSHALYFEKCAAIPFKIAAFTNLSREHGDFHRDMEDYYQAKFKLFKRAEMGIFNLDDEYSKRAYREFKKEKYSVGIFTPADVMAKDISAYKVFESEYVYREKGLENQITLHLGGIFNVYNSLFAIKAARLLGISEDGIKNGVSILDKIDGKNEIVSKSPLVIIDFAHTPMAFKNELFFLKSTLLPGQKLIVVFGCGGERDREKRAEIASLIEKYADFIIVSSDNSRTESRIQIFRDILKGIKSRAHVKVISSRKSAIIYAVKLATENDVVAIIGKGHERYNIDIHGKTHFDEREIIKSELERIKRDKCE